MFGSSKLTPLELAKIHLTEARLVHAEMGLPETAKLVERAQKRVEELSDERLED